MVKEFGFRDITALSVGAGSGIWEYVLLKELFNIKKIVSTDVVEGIIKESDQMLLRSLVEWEFCKVEADGVLPFHGSKFDLVYHLDVIEHTNNSLLFLSEQYRVLKPGGGIIIGTPNIFRLGNLLKLLTGRLKYPTRLGYRKIVGDYIHTHEYYDQMLKILLNCIGFYDIKFIYCYFGIPFINIVFSKYPKGNLRKSMCHYLMCMAKK